MRELGLLAITGWHGLLLLKRADVLVRAMRSHVHAHCISKFSINEKLADRIRQNAHLPSFFPRRVKLKRIQCLVEPILRRNINWIVLNLQKEKPQLAFVFGEL